MSNKTTKTVKVRRSKAEEWDEYADESPEYSSTSHLIRLAVEKEMSGEYDLSNRASGGESAETSGEVLTILRRIETAIGDVDERLSALEERSQAEESFSMKKAIYSLLPDGYAPAGMAAEDYESDEAVLSSRELANKLGADVSRVEDTLEDMAEESGLIHVEETESGLLYAMREP